MFVGYVDVTNYVKQNGIGEYTVADIALTKGNGGSTGFYGHWGLVVVYENSKMPWRDITIFDGYSFVQSPGDRALATGEFEISGFNAVLNGDVNFKFGVLAGEGDRNIEGDFLQVRNRSNEWVNLVHPLNSTENFFNSSIYTPVKNQDGIPIVTPRNPNFLNNTGIDIAMWEVPNSDKSIIGNNQTSLRFRYGTRQDLYTIYMVAFAVDAYVPDIQGVNQLTSVNGQTPGISPEVEPGGELVYTLEIRNRGTEGINDMEVVIPMPSTANYKSSSGSILFSPTNAEMPFFDPTAGSTGSLIWKINNLPVPPSGDPDEVLAVLTYTLSTTVDCFVLSKTNCEAFVEIDGIVRGQGAISESRFNSVPFISSFEGNGACSGEPISVPLRIPVINALSWVQNNCQGVDLELDFFFCNVPDGIPVTEVRGNFPVGTRFFDRNDQLTGIEFNENNPFPSTGGTFFAFPPNSSLCVFQFDVIVTIVTTNPGIPSGGNLVVCQDDTQVNLSQFVQLSPDGVSRGFQLFFFRQEVGGNAISNPIINTSVPGIQTFWVAEGPSGGCQGQRIRVDVQVLAKPNVPTFELTPPSCAMPTGVVSLSPSVGFEYSIDGNPFVTSNVFAGLPSGEYVFRVKNSAGCISDPLRVFVPNQPVSPSTPTRGPDQEICASEGMQSLIATATVNPGEILVWYNAEDASSPISGQPTLSSVGSITYWAEAVSSNGCTSPRTPVRLTINQCSISLEKLGSLNFGSDGIPQVGETISYSFVVRNTGNVTLSGITVNDPKATVSGTPITLLAGESNNTAFTAVYTLTQNDINAGIFTNTAKVTGTPPSGPVVEGEDEDVQLLSGRPSLSITKKLSAINGDMSISAYRVIGDVLTYEFTVTNTGNTTLTNVRVVDLLPNLSIISPETVTLLPTQIQVFTANYTVSPTDLIKGDIENVATARGIDPTNVDVISPPDSKIVVASFNPILAVDDTYGPINGANGGTTGSVLTNDTLNGVVVNPSDITLSLVTGNPSLTLNADGTITVAPGTAAGSYELTYSICEVLNPSNCATAKATVTVGAPAISAVDDTYGPINGANGGTTGSVLTNDTLNGVVVNPSDITLSLVTGNPSLTLNADGTITVAPGTAAGSYELTYSICEVLNPSNCATAKATVTVGAPAISAVDDTYGPINGANGGTTGSVLTNDTLNGVVVNPSDITLSLVTGNPSLTLNADGTITVAPGTAAGSYELTYSICEVLNPSNCATAKATVTVVGPAITAIDDVYGPINGVEGGITASVLINDTLNGVAVNPSDVTLTEVTGNPSLTLNSDGTITVAPGTAAGSYELTYSICEVLNPSNCATAKATVTVVGPAITAIDDVYGPINGANGGTTGSVLTNDTLNGVVVNPADVTLTEVNPVPGSPLTLNPDGTITIAPGTPSGEYTLEYSICEVLNPANCDTAKVTVKVVGPEITAIDDVYGPINGADGGTTASVLINDTLNGVPLNPSDVTLTEVTGNPSLTLNADGTITVAPGTAAGSYELTYSICEVLNPSNCATAKATVTVVGPAITAIDDVYGPINGADGGTTGSVLTNDTLNGVVVNPADVTLTEVNPVPGSPLTLNPDGTITIAPGTPSGEYTLEYSICEVLNPANCDTAKVTVKVVGPAITAIDDVYGPINGADGGTTGSVLTNDTLNGVVVNPADVTLTEVNPVPGSPLTLNPDGTITIAPGTPSGEYTLEYSICEVLNPANCDTAKVTVKVVGPAITAIDDVYGPINGADGGTTGSVLINDTLNGVVVNPADVTLTEVTGNPALTLNADGTITVAPGTAAGIYELTYSICEVLNPSNCATAKATVTVERSSISIEKTTDGTAVSAEGDVITYVLIVTNTGTSELKNVVAEDPLTGLRAVIGAMASGEVVRLTTTYTLTQIDVDRGQVYNLATVKGDDSMGGTVEDRGDNTTIIRGITSISVQKLADKTEVGEVGDEITYSLQVRNTGTVTLTNVVVTDPLTRFESKIDRLAPGEEIIFATTYTVTEEHLISSTGIVNTAYVRASDGNGNDVSDESTVTVDIVCPGLEDEGAKTDPSRDYFNFIRGFLKDNQGNVLSNVPVVLVPQGTTPGEGVMLITDNQGKYIFKDVIPGAYLLQVLDENLNAVRNLYPIESALFFFEINNCEYLQKDFQYEAYDGLVLGDFVWYDLNGDGVQNEWWDANNDGRVTKNNPSNTPIAIKDWEWFDLNGDGRYDGPQNEGELNKAGIGNARSANVKLTGPNSYSAEVFVGVSGRWRTRPDVQRFGNGEYTAALDLDQFLQDEAVNVRNSGLVKVLTLPSSKNA